MKDRIMKRWDEWEKLFTSGSKEDWPRKDFEMMIDYFYEKIDFYEKNYNPCGHTGFESKPCDICGYPIPSILIGKLKSQIAELKEGKNVSKV